MNPFFRLHLLLFPPACHICGLLMNPLAPEAPVFPFLCGDCREDLPWKDLDYSCQACGTSTAEPNRLRCLACTEREHHVARVWCAFHYVEHVRRWILSLKYRRNEALAHMLGALLRHAEANGASLEAFDLVLPVPLHPRPLRQRGFNQAYLLAHAWQGHRLRRGEGPALRTDILQRHRHTRPQVELPATEREANVAAAFSLRPQAAAPGNGGGVNEAEPLAGQRVLLVDDLMTTGATLNACAATLRQAGAERVEALVLARA